MGHMQLPCKLTILSLSLSLSLSQSRPILAAKNMWPKELTYSVIFNKIRLDVKLYYFPRSA